MNRSGKDLLSIGSFGRIAALSLKALRLYDQLGILKPIHIAPESGYRYYGVDQLREARLIRAMRQMDMPLATIRQVLASSPTDAELLLHDHLRTMEARVVRARLAIPGLVSELRNEETGMNLEVNVRTVGRQPIVSLTSRIRVDELDRRIRQDLGTLSGFVEGQGGTVAGAPFGLYHGPINEEDDGPIEVCVPVQQALVAEGEIESRELPGGQLAYVVLRGDECAFPAVLKGYDTVYDWIHRNGYELADAPREVWCSRPGDRSTAMEIAWQFHTPKGA